MKLIKISKDHYVIVDDSEIKIGDFYLVELFNVTGKSTGLHLEKCESIYNDWVNNSNIVSSRYIKNCRKIIHSTQPLQNQSHCENYGIITIQKVKQLFGEVDVEKKAQFIVMNYLTDNNPSGDFTKPTIGADDNKSWFIKGYNQALEDNKGKMYTKEDMRDAIEMAREKLTHPDWDYIYENADQIIQNFQQIEWGVEFTVDGGLKLIAE